MMSYKSAQLFEERFGRNPNRNGEDPWGLDGLGGGLIGGRFDIAGYLDLQGQRFIERFDANAYLAILRTMDTWDPLRGYSSPGEAFGRIRAAHICRHQLGLAVYSRRGTPVCRGDSGGGRTCRVPGDDQRPRARRIPGRTGGTGSAFAVIAASAACFPRRLRLISQQAEMARIRAILPGTGAAQPACAG